MLTIETSYHDVEHWERSFQIAMACIQSGWPAVIPQPRRAHRQIIAGLFKSLPKSL